MPFVPNTPESLIGRSDSKNPATTCKGITASGRPCRRALAGSKNQPNSGVLAVRSADDDDASSAAAFFCWQHKDQAEQLTQQSALDTVQEETKIVPLQERTSIDTLVARLGVLDVEDSNTQGNRSRRKPKRNSRPYEDPGNDRLHGRKTTTWDSIPGPLLSVPQDVIKENANERNKEARRHSRHSKQSQKRKKKSFWGALCGGGDHDDDYVEVVRHRKRADGHSGVGLSSPVPNRFTESTGSRPAEAALPPPRNDYQPRPRPENGRRGSSQQLPPVDRKPLGDKPIRPVNARRQSQTTNLLSYIPDNLSPKTTSLLLTELSKPVSQHDEPGYIYIFWLTPTTSDFTPSGPDAASLLGQQELAPSPQRPSARSARRASDVLLAYSNSVSRRGAAGAGACSPKTILLKIGRASNVQRRMNEWSRQCGHSLSLVRFYPYVPSTPSPSPSPRHSPATSRRPSAVNARTSSSGNVGLDAGGGVRKVPHAHRVERLIHLELAERRVKRDCEACGKEHREWFEVEANRGGVKAVDEVIKRWIGWAESQPE